MHALVHPPDGSQGLRVAAARALARALRDVEETRQQRVIAAIRRSRACPFDLHALLPIASAGLHSQGLMTLGGYWGVLSLFSTVPVAALLTLHLRAGRLEVQPRG
jgi:hypothetical protein